jgi:D-3-phosphoglycerate dehydrogenase
MVQLALEGDFVPFAVNIAAAEASETVKPFLALAERLGRLFASLAEGVPSPVEIIYEGQIADYDTRILTLAVMKGLFTGATDDPVSYVNAPQMARAAWRSVRSSR